MTWRCRLIGHDWKPYSYAYEMDFDKTFTMCARCGTRENP